MTSFLYGPGAHAMLVGAQATNPIAFLTDVMQVGLSSSTHVPNKDDTFLDDAGADDFLDGELSGTGYSRFTLSSGKTITYDAANDRVEIDAVDAAWTAIDAGTAAQATVFSQTGGADTARRMICNVDTGGFPIVTNGGDLSLQWHVDGVIQLTV